LEATPFVLIGSFEQVVDKLERLREQIGVSHVTITTSTASPLWSPPSAAADGSRRPRSGRSLERSARVGDSPSTRTEIEFGSRSSSVQPDEEAAEFELNDAMGAGPEQVRSSEVGRRRDRALRRRLPAR
jgi:hypothetical protein